MNKIFEPVFIEFITTSRRLQAQLTAHWPNSKTARSQRAIKIISGHVKKNLSQTDYGSVRIFISNRSSCLALPAQQGFVYDLERQRIITQQPVEIRDNPACVYVDYAAANTINQTSDDDELENQQLDKTLPVSKTEHLRQWQQDTIKAVFQAMADTALSMEAQTALRGALGGLNRLGAILNQPVSSIKQSATRHISHTLSELKSQLNIASSNGTKPTTRAQMGLRKQLARLEAIIPTKEKPALKIVPKIKHAVLNKTRLLSRPIVKAEPTHLKTISPVILRRTFRSTHSPINPNPTKSVTGRPSSIIRAIRVPQRLITKMITRIMQRGAINRPQAPIQQIVKQRRFIIGNFRVIMEKISARLLSSGVFNVTLLGATLKTVTPAADKPGSKISTALPRTIRPPARYAELSRVTLNPGSALRATQSMQPALMTRGHAQLTRYDRMRSDTTSTQTPLAARLAVVTSTQADAHALPYPLAPLLGEPAQQSTGQATIETIGSSTSHQTVSIFSEQIPQIIEKEQIRTLVNSTPPDMTMPAGADKQPVSGFMVKDTPSKELPVEKASVQTFPIHDISVRNATPLTPQGQSTAILPTQTPPSPTEHTISFIGPHMAQSYDHKIVSDTAANSTLQLHTSISPAISTQNTQRAELHTPTTLQAPEPSNIIPFRQTSSAQEKVQRERQRPPQEKSIPAEGAQIIHIADKRDKLPRSTTARLHEQYVADVHHLKVTVSSGIGTYRAYSVQSEPQEPVFSGKPMDIQILLADRPKEQKSGKSKVGKIPCPCTG